MDAPDKPIARWLRLSRESQRMEDTEGNSVPWTHKHLLAQMATALDWAPPHSNYSKYESGKATPNPTTLNKFKRFWKAYGIEGPDLSPKPAEPPPADPLIAAIDRNTEMLRQVLEALTARLPEPPPEVLRGIADAERQAAEERRQTTSLPRSPEPDPTGGRGTARLAARTAG